MATSLCQHDLVVQTPVGPDLTQPEYVQELVDDMLLLQITNSDGDQTLDLLVTWDNDEFANRENGGGLDEVSAESPKVTLIGVHNDAASDWGMIV